MRRRQHVRVSPHARRSRDASRFGSLERDRLDGVVGPTTSLSDLAESERSTLAEVPSPAAEFTPITQSGQRDVPKILQDALISIDI
jgi:hypothetical protein